MINLTAGRNPWNQRSRESNCWKKKLTKDHRKERIGRFHMHAHWYATNTYPIRFSDRTHPLSVRVSHTTDATPDYCSLFDWISCLKTRKNSNGCRIERAHVRIRTCIEDEGIDRSPNRKTERLDRWNRKRWMEYLASLEDQVTPHPLIGSSSRSITLPRWRSNPINVHTWT